MCVLTREADTCTSQGLRAVCTSQGLRTDTCTSQGTRAVRAGHGGVPCVPAAQGSWCATVRTPYAHQLRVCRAYRVPWHRVPCGAPQVRSSLEVQPRDLKTKSALQLLNEERASTPITTFVKELDNLLGGGVALGQLTGARHTAQQYWGLATQQYRAACGSTAA